MLSAIRKNFGINYCFKLGRTMQPKCQLTNQLTHRTKFCYSKNTGNDQHDKSNQNKKVDQQGGQQNQQNKRSIFSNAWFTAGLSAITGFGAFYLYQQKLAKKDSKNTKEIKNPFKSSPKNNVQIGGSWKLKDFNLKPFGSQNLKGWNYLIYFGFSKCPDICPTTLMYVSSMLRHLRSLPGFQDVKLKLIFVSLDPERDSPQKLKSWLASFDKEIIGVLGQSEVDPNLEKIKKDFKIYANKIYTPQDNDPQNQSGYKIDHTALVYLMNQKNQFLDLVNLSSSEKQEAARLLKTLKQENQNKK